MFIDDLWPAYERGEKKEEPDWVVAEREQFHKHRDEDGNGKLDKKELGDWILPKDFDHAEAEAKHLIYEADANKVCRELIACLSRGLRYPVHALRSNNTQLAVT